MGRGRTIIGRVPGHRRLASALHYTVYTHYSHNDRPVYLYILHMYTNTSVLQVVCIDVYNCSCIDLRGRYTLICCRDKQGADNLRQMP